MMTFVLQDIIVCIAISFTVGLYVGAFTQRRKDVNEIGALRIAVSMLVDY